MNLKLPPGTPMNPLGIPGGPDYARIPGAREIEVKIPLPVIAKGVKAIGRRIKNLFNRKGQ